MSKEERLLFTPSVDAGNTEVFKEKVYYRKGVQVDIVRPGTPLFLSNYTVGTTAELKPTLLAVKKNVPGFWNQETQKFEDLPLFLEDERQDTNPRHSPNVFENERRWLKYLKSLPHLSQYVPLVFDSEPELVVTEFREGRLLEDIIENPEFTTKEREKVAFQLMDFLFYLHTEANIHHNDFHDKSVIIEPDKRIVVFDFGMAGEKLTSQQEKWFDINQLNKTLVRLLTANLREKVRRLETFEIESYPEIQGLLSGVPFTEESFYAAYREFLKSNSA